VYLFINKEAGGMSLDDNDVRRPGSRAGNTGTPGWTSLHSWVFLAIVAIGLLLVVFENRHHYLNPQGLGKAYRIDKLFGGLQEFDPQMGWISARLVGPPPSHAAAAADPSALPTQAVPMNMPASRPAEALPSQPGAGLEDLSSRSGAEKKEVASSTPTGRETPAVQPAPSAPQPPPVEEKPTMTREERLKSFVAVYPDYGEEEFQLASDDLFPEWKKSVPDGNWQNFLKVYGEFIQWWTDAGSPPEPGFKLWKDFMAGRRN